MKLAINPHSGIQIEVIGKMDAGGVPEAFVLLAIPTRGIAVKIT